MLETFDALNLSVNLRIVIKFVLMRFSIWIHEDEGGMTSDLDEGKRKKEFEYKSDK